MPPFWSVANSEISSTQCWSHGHYISFKAAVTNYYELDDLKQTYYLTVLEAKV